MNHPDPKKHLKISLYKSGIRIVAGISLMFGSLVFSGILFILAESLGVLEELV